MTEQYTGDELTPLNEERLIRLNLVRTDNKGRR